MLNNFPKYPKKSSQRWLLLQIKKLLPEDTEIVEDYHHPLLSWTSEPLTLKMQVDIWVPKYNLAIEYQGEQHFHDIAGFGPGGSLAIYEIRDSMKKEIAVENKNQFPDNSILVGWKDIQSWCNTPFQIPGIIS